MFAMAPMFARGRVSIKMPRPDAYDSAHRDQSEPQAVDDCPELTRSIFGRRQHYRRSRQAIGDTIGALNTGIWRDREGAIITRISTRQSFTSVTVKDALAECVTALTGLRVIFDEGLRNNHIQPCQCGKADCPTFMIEHEYCERLENERSRVLNYADVALSGLGSKKLSRHA